MDPWFEVLKIILPAVIVFLTTFYMIQSFLKKAQQDQLAQAQVENQKLITPVRLQAYERLVLYLERITVSQLITRVHKSGMSGKMLHHQLIKTIREEHEHNFSQQIYVSEKAWELIRKAKEETINLINVAAGQAKADATGLEVAKKILELDTQLNSTSVRNAIQYTSREIKKLL